MSGQGYIDDAVEALTGSNVYVSPEVSGATALRDQLSQQIGDQPIGVAVFSSNAALEASGTEILSTLAEQHPQFQTIIISVGGDLAAGSRDLPSGEALRIANEAEGSAGSTEAALVETVQTVIAATDTAGPVSPDAGGAVGIGIGAVLVVAALGAALGVFLGVRRSRRRAAGERTPLPDSVRETITRLRALSGEYAAAGASGNRLAAQVAPEIAGIAANASELFERLDRKGDEGQLALGAVEYGETLRKLTAALDRDYFLDILTHPHLWDDPDERVAEVREAITDVSGELVANIKQVNARRGLHFQVSLDGVIGRRKELKDWEREFDRADGDTGPIARPQ
ncbi:hypothetical protein [Microbacterium sp. RU33B]|uniref:hypothetical protein n=1 Tax=Microbacterium sp. RU33B TaxID=1907390 RepID=UPI000975419A|nr:hypothetical protein [Microbacterium sp. RU33B]